MSPDNIEFANPLAFLLLAVVPLLLYLAFRERYRVPVLRFSDAQVLRQRPGAMSKVWWFPHLLRIAAAVLTVFALARPRVRGEKVRDTSVEGIDIVVCFDLSTSMNAADFKPKDRISVAKGVLDEFLAERAKRGTDRIGLVVFASEAFTQSPLTLDYSVVRQIISSLRTGVIEDGTAIGNAVATAVNRLRDSKAKSKVIVLITDGDNNAGQISPVEAAKLAAEQGIKIYAVLVGKGGIVPVPTGVDIFGQPIYAQAEIDVNPELLKEMVELTHGAYYNATDRESLRSGLQDILDKLEKSKIVEGGAYENFTDVFGAFLTPALALLILEAFLGFTWWRSFP
jgi:Ca-activated chloride channel homolog